MSSAKLNGKVNPNGRQTGAWFRWGLTTDYGNTTIVQDAGSGINLIPFSQTLTGLAGDTTYHFQAIAENASGLVFGADESFLTGAAVCIDCSSPDPVGYSVHIVDFNSSDFDATGCSSCGPPEGGAWNGTFPIFFRKSATQCRFQTWGGEFIETADEVPNSSLGGVRFGGASVGVTAGFMSELDISCPIFGGGGILVGFDSIWVGVLTSGCQWDGVYTRVSGCSPGPATLTVAST
jgi:hypothetical protein